MSNIFFTSDTHFGHANIIKYCNRPFSSVSEMDDTIIRNWNSVVGPTDIVYHLGDFAVGGGPAQPYLVRLNGVIRFCWGNHDNRLKDLTIPITISDMREEKLNGQRIVMCHYAMRVWNKSHHGAWHIYGHSHGTLPDDPNALSCDVGVDCWNYFPVSMDQLRAKMKSKTFKPVDHHGDATT